MPASLPFSHFFSLSFVPFFFCFLPSPFSSLQSCSLLHRLSSWKENTLRASLSLSLSANPLTLSPTFHVLRAHLAFPTLPRLLGSRFFVLFLISATRFESVLVSIGLSKEKGSGTNAGHREENSVKGGSSILEDPVSPLLVNRSFPISGRDSRLLILS